MAKKLKMLSYNSKAEFIKDLDQIWTNCLTYNTLPESIYRKHAFAMKSRSASLLKKVPDIHIRLAGQDESDDEGSISVSITK